MLHGQRTKHSENVSSKSYVDAENTTRHTWYVPGTCLIRTTHTPLPIRYTTPFFSRAALYLLQQLFVFVPSYFSFPSGPPLKEMGGFTSSTRSLVLIVPFYGVRVVLSVKYLFVYLRIVIARNSETTLFCNKML